MRKYELTQTIEHKSFEQPKVTSTVFEVMSVSAFCKRLKLSGEQICNLKNYSKAEWVDQNDAKFTLELKEII